MTNCPPNYQNIQCESFGEKRKITSQLLRQFCKNDAYLKEQIDLLWDTTDPESRKRFYPPDYMDITNSYGIGEYKFKNSLEKKNYFIGDSVYNFNSIDRFKYTFDFDLSNDKISEEYQDSAITTCVDIEADNLLDLDNSYDELKLEVVRNDENTATLRPPLSVASYLQIINHDPVYETITETDNGKTYVKQKKETLGKAKLDAYFRGAKKTWDCNNHWYNGFDCTKNYNVKSKWKKDPYGEDKTIIKKYGRIPSVCHAQTFKAKSNGRITKINLNIQGDKNATSPCVVEIRTTSKGYPTDKVLARVEKKFNSKGENIVAFEFKKDKAKVTKGKTYAIVVRSPFSHFEKTYRWGGWTTGCFSSSSKYYGNGSAFTSTDNGHTWKKNGKTSDTKSYGSHYYDWGINQKPVDFGFEVYVAPVTVTTVKKKVSQKKKGESTTQKKTYQKLVAEAYPEEFTWQYLYISQGKYYLYLKPIMTNPIDWFEIQDNFVRINNGVEESVSDSPYWTWEYYDPTSQEEDKWTPMTSNMIDFPNTITNYNVLKLRVCCDITQNTFGGLLSRDDEGMVAQDSTLINEIVNQEKILETPLDFLKGFTLRIGCYPPSEAYLRTHYYRPVQTEILGANIWSEIGVQAMTFGKADLKIDVIHERENVEHIKFYDLTIIQNVKKQTNNETHELEYVDSELDSLASEEQVRIFDEVCNILIEYDSNASNMTTGEQIILYVYNAFMNETGFIEWCKSKLEPIYFLPLIVDGVPVDFFTEVQLKHLPSYPLVGGDIGDDDIIIDTSLFSNLSDSGFIYRLPKPVNEMLDSVYVSYNTVVNVVTDNSTETSTVADITDEEGFVATDNEEHIVEHLRGITLEQDSSQILTTQTHEVLEGLFKKDEEDDYPDKHIDYGITSDGLTIVFNSWSRLIRKLFPNLYDDDEDIRTDSLTIVTLKSSVATNPNKFDFPTTLTSDSVKDFQIVVDLTTKTYQEFIDFKVNYDKGTIKFYNNEDLIHGDFKLTYNPLWVRGLGIADFPLKMDLWKEKYAIRQQNGINKIFKQRYDKDNGYWINSDISYEKTMINPFTKEKDTVDGFYCFKTSVPARDNIRRLTINEGTSDERDLEEDSQFFVDYLTNTVTLYVSDLKENDTLTIRYTPNLTDNGLALAYRLKRPRYMNGEEISEEDENYLSAMPNDEEDDVWIGMNYFTYRT